MFQVTEIAMEGKHLAPSQTTDPSFFLQDQGFSVLPQLNDAKYREVGPPTPLVNPPTPPQDQICPALPNSAATKDKAGLSSPASSDRMSMNQTSVQRKRLKNFPLFTNLLPELQLHIWDVAAAQPRIIELTKPFVDQDEGYMSDEEEPTELLYSKTTFPALFHACIDARAAACRAYGIKSERSRFEAIPQQLIINWGNDTIFFSSGNWQASMLELGQEKCGMIRSLAVTQDWWCVFVMDWNPEVSGDLPMWFTSLEEVVILIPRRYPLNNRRSTAPTYLWKPFEKNGFDTAWAKKSEALATRWNQYQSAWSRPLRGWPAINYTARRRTHMRSKAPNPQIKKEVSTDVAINIQLLRGIASNRPCSDSVYGQGMVTVVSGDEEISPDCQLCHKCLRKKIKDHIKMIQYREGAH